MTDRELFIKALDALEKMKSHSYLRLDYAEEAINALRDRLAQPEQELVTGNLLKDAYNAMVEEKTRSQKLREAGFTRRPKGWEKEKDEQEPVCDKAPRPWVGLTEPERLACYDLNPTRFASAIENSLKEKNT